MDTADTKRIALSSTWSSFVKQHERSEAIASNPCVRFDMLYQRYYASVLAFLRFLVGTPEVAEDLTSLVFEKALTHFSEVRTPDSTGAWLFRIARNCATDYFRRCNPHVSLERLLPNQHPQVDSLEEETIAREERRVLLTHLGRLSGRELEVIGLKFAAGLNNREIARVLQIPEGTVGSLLYRTLRQLRAALYEKGEDDER
ncbi:MAG: sigma-70 family RNA polymerase sigma factor [Ktedonobacteraceae bacterium]